MMFQAKCFIVLVLLLKCCFAAPANFHNQLLEKLKSVHTETSCPCEFQTVDSYDPSTCASGCKSFNATEEDTGEVGMTCCQLQNPPSFTGRFDTKVESAASAGSVRQSETSNVAKEMSGKIKLRFPSAKEGITSVTTRGYCIYTELCGCNSRVCVCYWELACY